MNNKIKTFTVVAIIFLFVNVQAQNTLLIPDRIEVNELHMLPDSGRSGYPVSITYTINNTEISVRYNTPFRAYLYRRLGLVISKD